MGVSGLDHVALPTHDANRLISFYRALGFSVIGEEDWRSGRRGSVSIVFGDNKINVHTETLRPGHGSHLSGDSAEPGCGDLCFVWEGGIDLLVDLLHSNKAEVLTGPDRREGGRGGGSGRGVSVYTRDPDGNLLEFMSYDEHDVAQHWSN